MDDPQTLDLISEFLGEDAGKDVEPVKLLVRGTTVSEFDAGEEREPGDKIVFYRRENFSSYLTLVEETPTPPAHTAEEWLSLRGFSSIQLVTLLDLENQLASAERVSEKLVNVRAWINGILAAYVQNPSPRFDWPQPPFTFQETTAEAFAELSAALTPTQP